MVINVLHTISSLNLSSGGPSQSTWSLVKGLRKSQVNAQIVTYKLRYEEMIGNDDFVHALPSPYLNRFGYSKKQDSFLAQNNYELYHGHGLWQFPVHAMAKAAYKNNKPYIITPRGMLYPAAMKKSTLFKKIAFNFFQKKDLQRAAVIHATCKQELIHIRNLGFKKPIALIPNSVSIDIPPKIEGIIKDKKQIGFIGRLAPIKNIELLIIAWAETGKSNSNWELVIIGDGELSYKKELIQLIKKLEIKNIRFTGFLNGDEKEKALQSLNFLVLPSKSENFGMVVAEALIREIPVIASRGTPWQELNTRNAGWWIDIGVDPLKKTLELAMLSSSETLLEMGVNGRKLIEEKYSMEAVSGQMIELYQWVLNKGEKPEFVDLI